MTTAETDPEPDATEPIEPTPPPDEPDPEELDAEEPSDDEEPPPPPAPPDLNADDVDMEKAFKSLEREATRHANRVSEIMGVEAQGLEPCPRCIPAIPGFIYPPDIAPVPPEIVAAVKVSMGELGTPEYEPAPHARVCDRCKGHGRVRSGSLVAGQELILCPDCPNGRGWVQVGDDIPARAVGNGDAPHVEPIVAPEPLPDVDPWGRAPTDPNYGRMPQYVVTS